MYFPQPSWSPGANGSSSWAIVLAGGAGARLAPWITERHGAPVPKQYCSLRGGRSLLADALRRADIRAAPERVLAVVAEEHEPYWRRELAGRPPDSVLVQPQNRGTAIGILLPLLQVIDRDPEARVLLLPADHYYEREGVLMRSLHKALEGSEVDAGQVVVLGFQPDSPETGYGWIVPGCRIGATATVAAFVEKPPLETAVELWQGGALWNSFVLAAHARVLFGMLARSLPDVVAAFLNALGSEARLRELYARLPSADFSRDVLQGCARQLRVLPVPACGFSDLGTPQRVQRCLRGLGPRAAAPRCGPPSLASLDART